MYELNPSAHGRLMLRGIAKTFSKKEKENSNYDIPAQISWCIKLKKLNIEFFAN